jgi:DNA-binding XRE family transcriptional regulator
VTTENEQAAMDYFNQLARNDAGWGRKKAAMTFVQMLVAVRSKTDMSQKEFAAALGFTPQYLCDLEHGRRPGSVEFVNRLCDWLEHGPKARKAWHLAAARAHGWEV